MSNDLVAAVKLPTTAKLPAAPVFVTVIAVVPVPEASPDIVIDSLAVVSVSVVVLSLSVVVEHSPIMAQHIIQKRFYKLTVATLILA